MESCRICDAALGGPVYESPEPVSVTSLCQVLEGHTRVWHCRSCGHLQTLPLPALDRFYAEDYHILTASEEDDQLYALAGGRKIFRTEHQLATLRDKVTIADRARVLDYGCGKAATLKALCHARPDVSASVFDVGEQYRGFWDRFLPRERQAVDAIPDAWLGSFDLVTSFYALEHVAEPLQFMATVRSLLRDGGTLYFLVPNVYENTADFVVADHVNHFSARSLAELLRRSGFAAIDIDDRAHASAWVVTARKVEEESVTNATEVADEVVSGMASYWREFGNRVRQFEADREGAAAVYGSGFYGTFIHTCLARPERVRCFLDQNPHRQKQQLAGLPIVAPDDLPADVTSLYVGLNPRIAREVVDALDQLRPLADDTFYP